MTARQSIPKEALARRLAFVGTTGSGKTYTAKGGVERKLAARERVVIIDPLDVWWGLRLNVDGKNASPFEVMIFGGKHADMQITENGGKLLGEAIATAKESCIVSLGTLRTEAARRRFMVAFLDALYEHTDPEIAEPYTLVIDEADMFAPQKPFGGHAEMLLHLMEEIVRRGRVRGFLPWLITQRPSILNKNVLSQVDGLIAMQLTGAHDRKAIEAWIEGHADKSETKELLASFAGYPQGTGLLWVPRDGILKTMAFPENVTFDSSRTPKRGEKKKTAKLKPLNLDRLKDKLATVEAETKANDPTALKKQVAELQTQLRKIKTSAPAAAPVVDKAAIAQLEDRARVRGKIDGYGEAVKDVSAIVRDLTRALPKLKTSITAIEVASITFEGWIKRSDAKRADIAAELQKSGSLGTPAKAATTPKPAPAAAGPARQPSPAASGDGGLSKPQLHLLKAMAWWLAMGHSQPTRTQLAAIAGWRVGGSNMRGRLSELSTAGLIHYPASGSVALTEAGQAAAPAADTNQTLIGSIKGVLTNPQLQLFDQLLTTGTTPITREDLAAAVGWEAGGSNMRGRLSELSAIEVIEYPGRGMGRTAGMGGRVITLNPDGVSIKGCSMIYAPGGQAGEYSPLAVNPYRGCGHACKYCYVPLATKQPRAAFNAGAELKENFFPRLLKDAAKYQAAGITEQVMCSFTSDPYHPGDCSPTRRTFEILRDHGLGFCALTKGGTKALQDIELYRPHRDAFACTMTSLDNDFSVLWEPGAALPADRIAALMAFHRRGIFTWISPEPTLDFESSLAIVEATHSFVDLYKVGRANYLKELTRTTDWKGYTQRMITKLQRLDKAHYIKRDLQPFLPAGYFNPLRVPQHFPF